MKARIASVALTLVALALPLAGCHGHSLPTTARAEAKAQQRAVAESQREELQLIPPPSKNRYMTVHSFDTWENPYITVQSDMLTLHVLIADANTTSIGLGGMTRPIQARQRELNISLDKLGEAISAIPESAWPYGRVIAIEEAHKVPANAEPAVRRTMETTVGMLNDLGVVAYDMNEGNLR